MRAAFKDSDNIDVNSLFSQSRKLTEVYLPSNLTSIKKYAFFTDDALTEIDIPETVTSIGENAFAQGNQIRFRINFYSPQPPSVVIDNEGKKGTFYHTWTYVHAPAEYLPAYQAAWSGIEQYRLHFVEMEPEAYLTVDSKFLINNKAAGIASRSNLKSNIHNRLQIEASGYFDFMPSFTTGQPLFREVAYTSGAATFSFDDAFGMM